MLHVIGNTQPMRSQLRQNRKHRDKAQKKVGKTEKRDGRNRNWDPAVSRYRAVDKRPISAGRHLRSVT